MKLKCIVLLFLMYFKSDITFASKHISADYFTTKQLEIKELIERGLFNNAHLKCESLLKQHLSNDQRYEIITTQSKLYFWEENMFAFKMAAQEAVKLKPNQPIYKAYYHAQIAFYYHYSFISDSSIINSDKSIFLLRKHFNQRHQVGTHFIYQMYATSFLYRKIRDANNKIEEFACPQRLHYYTTYFDSALYIVRQLNHFPQEEAIIYRSKGSRIFDFIGYHVRTKPSDFKNPTYEWEKFNKIKIAYQAAISCLPKKEKSLRKNLEGMLAMAYYVCMKEEKADSITLPYIEKFYKNPVGEMGPSLINSLSLLSNYIRNAIAKEYSPQKLLKVKSILERILPLWRKYKQQKNSKFSDDYGISPNFQLLMIEAYFLNKKPAWANKKNMLDLTLDHYAFYSKNEQQKNQLIFSNQSFLQQLARLEVNPTDEYLTKNVFSVYDKSNEFKKGYRIQSKLKDREALLLNVTNSVYHPFYILVQRNRISVFKINTKLPSLNEVKNFDLISFKIKSFHYYKKSGVLPEIIRRKIKKIYVIPDKFLIFDWVITSSKGKQFGALSYFKKKVNVVKIYNPLDFFLTEKKERFISPKMGFVWLNEASIGKLPFSGIFINSQKKKTPIFKSNDLLKKGVLQIIGHGGIETYSDLDAWNSSLESQELDEARKSNFRVKKELVIFNVCYAGRERGEYLPELGVKNILLSHGTKAVIASPYQTIDQSSAYIFKKFYSYLFKGQTVEDALQLAKLDYLKKHSGVEAHPIYWSTYELTSNVKDLRLAQEPKSDKSWQAYLLLFVLTAIVLRFYLFWEEY
ncbi:MAG: hypothetical protein RL264_1410 [Bacteroidota bacterium]